MAEMFDEHPLNKDLSGSGDGPGFEDDEEDELAIQQTRNLRRFRLCFVFSIFVIALGLAVGIYFLTRKQEENSFSTTFYDRAAKIMNTFQVRMEQNAGAIESFSFSLTSYAAFTNKTWPFVTLPDFEVKAASARALAGSVSLTFSPLVTAEEKKEWEVYSVQNREWVQQGLDFEERFGIERIDYRSLQTNPNTAVISSFDQSGDRLPAQGDGPFFPVWQSSPVAERMINLDLDSIEVFSVGIDAVWENGNSVLGQAEVGSTIGEGTLEAFRSSWSKDASKFYEGEGPVVMLFVPIYDELEPATRTSTGVLVSLSFWESFMHRVLPSDQGGLYAVIKSECGDSYTYTINGDTVVYVGEGDLHDQRFNDMSITDVVVRANENADTFHGIELEDLCNYTLTLYPNQSLEDEFMTPTPWLFFGLVLVIFLLTTLIIFFYDWKVEKNYQETYRKAKQAGAIVSSIFPAAVRRRLYEEENSDNNNKIKGQGGFKQAVPLAVDSQKTKLKGFLQEDSPTTSTNGHGRTRRATQDNEDDELLIDPNSNMGKAIADLFPNTTILFADIVGFTAWSSQREPGEVFTLLQTLYQEFDSIARQLKVFKVETIGDCYVAATGLPEPQDDHALRMARFATKMMNSMIDVTRQLEVRLGPDTGELRCRMGMHSGPVTAGVLRGTKARFQLFGDTMNFAARMEHHSAPNQIQCSEFTADLIKKAGKEHWLRPRADKVKAKGKGELQTYWIVPKSGGPSMASTEDDLDELVSNAAVEDDYNNPWGNTKMVFDLGTPGNRYQRLIDWNVELLAGLLKQIEAQRRDLRMRNKDGAPTMELKGGSTALDEVTEIITLPQFKTKSNKKKTRPEDVELTIEVVTQLRDYVTTIASMYRDNPFHNFEHASHVTMSTNKLLKRVTVRHADNEEVNASDLHDYTYGITSDPLTQFTLVFCALVHDVDHAGVSNFQLIQEGATIAKLYKNKSVAEQNSVDLAWDLLMDPNYKELQKAIYTNEDELKRFRQLMVNIVLATDIFDADMKAIRERRWGKAFQYEEEEEQELPNQPLKALERDYETPLSQIEGANLKATIVMEHLIQASDVAHTMQHWQIYLKWNERLFCEMYSAFENGRSAKDPSVGWYEGEIMFFDKYVIPLAKKLDDCGVFGVSSDECLNYAAQNRKQWAIKGDEIVQAMVQRYRDAKMGKSGKRGHVDQHIEQKRAEEKEALSDGLDY